MTTKTEALLVFAQIFTLVSIWFQNKKINAMAAYIGLLRNNDDRMER